MKLRLDISTPNGIFAALREIQNQCEIRANSAADTCDEDEKEDWAYLAGNIEDAMEGLEHLQDCPPLPAWADPRGPGKGRRREPKRDWRQHGNETAPT